MAQKQKLELIWIGKENRPRLEPRILLEDPERDELIGKIEKQMEQRYEVMPVFTVRWTLE